MLNIKESAFTNKIKMTVDELFDIKKGKSVYTNKYFHEHTGSFPVYSSQTENNGELGKIATYDFDTIAYINQQIADIIPINLILFSSLLKNVINVIKQAKTGNIE